MNLFTISYGRHAVDQRSGVVDSVDDLKSSRSLRETHDQTLSCSSSMMLCV